MRKMVVRGWASRSFGGYAVKKGIFFLAILLSLLTVPLVSSTVSAADPTATGTPVAVTDPCHGGALGWVVCPLINAMTEMIRTIGSMIDSVISFRLLSDKGDVGKSILENTRNFINIANVLLFIFVLVILVSQATSQGLSSLNIKRMLPRLLIVAILVNASFYICAAMTDVTGVIGNAVGGLLPFNDPNSSSANIGMDELDGEERKPPNRANATISHVLGYVIGEDSGAFRKYYQPILTSIPLTLLTLFLLFPLWIGVMILFFFAVFRQILLVVLVFLSPVAIAAWMLPNTEQLFHKWRRLFVNLLFVFPFIMFVFAIAYYLAYVIGQLAIYQNDLPELNDDTQYKVAKLVGLLVISIAFILAPFMLKLAGGLFAKLETAGQKFGAQQVKRFGGGKDPEGRQNMSANIGMMNAKLGQAMFGVSEGSGGRRGGGYAAHRKARKHAFEGDGVKSASLSGATSSKPKNMSSGVALRGVTKTGSPANGFSAATIGRGQQAASAFNTNKMDGLLNDQTGFIAKELGAADITRGVAAAQVLAATNGAVAKDAGKNTQRALNDPQAKATAGKNGEGQQSAGAGSAPSVAGIAQKPQIDFSQLTSQEVAQLGASDMKKYIDQVTKSRNSVANLNNTNPSQPLVAKSATIIAQDPTIINQQPVAAALQQQRSPFTGNEIAVGGATNIHTDNVTVIQPQPDQRSQPQQPERITDFVSRKPIATDEEIRKNKS